MKYSHKFNRCARVIIRLMLRAMYWYRKKMLIGNVKVDQTKSQQHIARRYSGADDQVFALALSLKQFTQLHSGGPLEILIAAERQ